MHSSLRTRGGGNAGLCRRYLLTVIVLEWSHGPRFSCLRESITLTVRMPPRAFRINPEFQARIWETESQSLAVPLKSDCHDPTQLMRNFVILHIDQTPPADSAKLSACQTSCCRGNMCPSSWVGFKRTNSSNLDRTLVSHASDLAPEKARRCARLSISGFAAQ